MSETPKKPLLVLFDGNALVHRAFHALPPLTVGKTGELVNAVFGFATTVMKVLIDLEPTHYTVAFDKAAPTFRHHRFEHYKEGRPPTPDELKNQFARVRELVEAFPIPVYEMEGYEADDVLGTLARQASEMDIESIIVTGDADAMQLVSPRVKVLTPKKTFGDVVLYDEAEVYNKYGVGPGQIPDLKGLEGDTSDNIPGVKGIGEKTAVRLLQQFKSVEEIYQHLAEVTPPRVKELLEAGREQALWSKELATIARDVPITFDPESSRRTTYNHQRVVDLFRELEFTSLIPRLSKLQKEPDPSTAREPGVETVEGKSYTTVRETTGLQDVLSEISSQGAFVLELETTSTNPFGAELVGIAVSPSPGKAYYLPVGHRTLSSSNQLPLPQVIESLKPVLQDTRVGKVAHNAKYDMTVLSRYGVELKGLAFDTMLAAYLLGDKSLSLKALALGRLGLEMKPITELIGTGSKQLLMSQVEINQATEYACAEADITGRLRPLLEEQLRRKELWKLFSEVEMPLAPVLMKMESHGVALDLSLLRELSQNLGQQMQRLEAGVYNAVGHTFNLNSSQQLAAVLFDDLKLPRSRKTKSGYSTEASILEELKGAHPVVGLILEYRQLAKIKSTYADALPAMVSPQTGRVHTIFNQTGTVTGRLSSSDPNLQNIPVRGDLGRQVRKAFVVPPPCFLVAADYSQIDLRVLAHFSQDPSLLAAFWEGQDIHTATAAQVFGIAPSQITPDMRRIAKTVNFGVIYGMSEYGLEQATELTREEAAKFIASYFEKYAGVKKYLEETKQQARDQGYVQTILGRRRYIPEIKAPNRQLREAAERTAINMPVQGTSADIIKVAMIDLQHRLEQRGLKSKMILQVHDELLFEVPPDELEEIRRLALESMSRAIELSVPLKVDVKVGKNWGELE